MIWDTIFTAGRHIDSQGRAREWSEADLDELVKSADVPLVAFHPADQNKASTFGKTAALRRVGRELQATYTAVPEAVATLVKEGLKLCKSVSIDPQTMRLRHIGLLGAGQEPAVAGLGYLSFAKQSGDVEIKLEMGMDKDQEIAALKQKVAELEAKAAGDESRKALDHAKAELETEKAARAKDAAEFAAYKKEVETAALKARVQRLAETGRILPAEVDATMAFAQAMTGGETMDFSKDGKVEKITAREAYLRGLEARQENHTGLLSEFAKQGGGKPETLDLSKINQFA